MCDKQTDVSAGRKIETEVLWCPDNKQYVGVVSYPPDRENPWIIVHEEFGQSPEAIEAGMERVRGLPSWPCRYCTDWALMQAGDTFLRNGVCVVCGGTKNIRNPAAK
jgi:hypothetical protein